jgi:hypothetical protein
MERRELLKVSVGALLTSAVGGAIKMSPPRLAG